MQEALGEGLCAFEAALERLRAALSPQPEVLDFLFADTGEWRALLTYKLVPHLAGAGCLVVAVAGGTNTGKSTVFNLLLGETASPVRATAAATCRPLLAASPMRCAQCMEAKLVPEFTPVRLASPEDVLHYEGPENALYIYETGKLPDVLALLDTPDIDSIMTRNWQVAEHLRAAGDVVVAVLTPEKYKDERVITFFRAAHAAGRLVVPVMNKANPAEDFAAARRQLDDFCGAAGLGQAPGFVVPYDPSLARNPSRPVLRLDGRGALGDYLADIDVVELKRRVYRDSVARFVQEAGGFLEKGEWFGAVLRRMHAEVSARAQQFAREYDPAPGPEVGGLFHQFVQSKRGAVGRAIGQTSSTIARGAIAFGRVVRRAVVQRATFESGDTPETESALRQRHRAAIERITRDLATSLLEMSRRTGGPAAQVLRRELELLDLTAIGARVAEETLTAESISEAFRQHARKMLDTWWEQHREKRHVLLALDLLLALTPAAIAVPISLYTGGIGVPEAMIVAGPLMEQFVARVIEYQFGDALFDFLSPWREEQRAALAAALARHLIEPAQRGIAAALAPLESEALATLGEQLDLCRKALQTS